MNEPYPGGPGGGYQPRPGRRRQPDHWPGNDHDEWRRPPRGQERGPGQRGFPGERDRAARYRQGGPRRPELDQTTVDQITVLDRARPAPTGVLASQGHRASRGRPPANLDWTLARRNWALSAGLAFFLVDTFFMADGFARPVAAATRVLVIFIWLLSLAAVGLLWLRGSSRFSVQNPFVRAETGSHQR
jgi:hypothetical protein